MASVLNADSGDTEKIAEMVAECKRMGIDVLPPNINESFEGFTVVKNSEGKEQIRFGLSTIKNFGEGIAHSIIEERKSGGKFKSLEDFLTRINDRNLNKKSLEALIKSGAMDELGDRSKMYGNLEVIIEYNKEVARGPKNQDSLFGDLLQAPPLRLEESENISSTQQLSWEKELLGLYVSGNPLEQYKEKIEKNSVKISKIKENPPKPTVTITVVGTVEEVKVIKTKKGDDMAFVKLADLEDNLECVVFPKLFASHKQILNTDSVLVVEGKVSMRNDLPSLIIDKIKRLC
jgi:DNA polymerase-3 subunit alpha